MILNFIMFTILAMLMPIIMVSADVSYKVCIRLHQVRGLTSKRSSKPQELTTDSREKNSRAIKMLISSILNVFRNGNMKL